ncbi:MAG: hypothetical protein ACM3NO_01035 [Deltaproteobacteria bacterium]
MSQDLFRSSRAASVSGSYRFFRSLVRLWISVTFGNLRVLAAEEFSANSPAVLVVSHPGGFLEALFLIASSERQICCMVDRRQIEGFTRKFLARQLGMIPYEAEGGGLARATEKACNILGNLGALAIFTDFQPADVRQPARFAMNAASLVLEAESRNGNQLDVMVIPVHLVLSRMRWRGGELLIHFDRRIKSQTYMLPGKPASERRPALSIALDEVCQKNTFRLHPEDIRNFLADVEGVLLADLREEFATRKNWKQRVEDFELSGFINEWIEELNRLDPGRLAHLRQLLHALQQADQNATLRKLEVEAAGPWVQSAFRRLIGWAETFIGFPVALYGLVNHLPSLAILRATGLAKRQSESNRTAVWISRAAIVSVLYAVQILLCNYLVDRAAAGYYALSLPVSALYLWRYVSLLRLTTRFLYLHARGPHHASLARKKRREFIEKLNVARDRYVEAIGLAS